MKIKNLKDGEIRIIRISEACLWEHIENIIKKDISVFFDFPRKYKNTFYYQQWDNETQSFICFVSRTGNVDIEMLKRVVTADTATSMYQSQRYISLDLDNLECMKHSRDSLSMRPLSTLHKRECRIIRLSKDAIFELLYEDFIDNLKEYFDASYEGSHYYWQWDSVTHDFIFAVASLEDVDWDEIMTNVPVPTTISMNGYRRYVQIYAN